MANAVRLCGVPQRLLVPFPRGKGTRPAGRNPAENNQTEKRNFFMELLLLRHSITPGNLKKQYVGITDQPLAPEGEALAREKRKDMPPAEALWISPMLRCRQTARILFPELEPVEIPDLRECNFGDFEGRTWAEIKDHPAYQAWMGGEQGAALPNGESVAEFYARCRRGFQQVIQQAASLGIQRGAVVAHGGTWMAVLEAYGRPKRPFYQWQPKNCSGFRMEVRENPLELRLLEEL